MSVEDGIAALQGLLGRVSRIEGMIPQFRWGQVTSVAGLEVQLDGPGLPVPITSTLVRPAVGDRVLVLFWLRRSVILGVAGGGDSTVTVSGVVSFGQWNLRSAASAGDTGNRAWSYRCPLVAQTVREAGLGVVAVQEIAYNGQANDQGGQLVASLRAEAPTQDWRYESHGATVGLLWRGDLYEAVGPGGYDTPASLAWVLLRHRESGVRFIAASAHWAAYDAAARLAQAQAANTMLAALKAQHKTAVILGADTNDYGATEGAAITAMNGAQFLDLRAAHPAATRSEWPTWHNWKPDPPWTADGQSNNEWLDQIFIDRSSTVLAGGIHDTTLPLTSALYSDHHLVTALVRVTGASGNATTRTVTVSGVHADTAALAADATRIANIQFGVRFEEPPVVVCQPRSTAVAVGVPPAGVTRTGATVQRWNHWAGGTANASFMWTATGQVPADP